MSWTPIAAPRFLRRKKKQHPTFQEELDRQVRAILENPLIGEPKKGILKGVRVHKFPFRGQEYLLAYEPVAKAWTLYLYDFGVHEKFYERLERYVK